MSETLIKAVWESYGNKITNMEDPITFFDIFNDQIIDSSGNIFNLESMYKEYAIWRYFTGDRAIPNEYFSNVFFASEKDSRYPIKSFSINSFN